MDYKSQDLKPAGLLYRINQALIKDISFKSELKFTILDESELTSSLAKTRVACLERFISVLNIILTGLKDKLIYHYVSSNIISINDGESGLVVEGNVFNKKTDDENFQELIKIVYTQYYEALASYQRWDNLAIKVDEGNKIPFFQ